MSVGEVFLAVLDVFFVLLGALIVVRHVAALREMRKGGGATVRQLAKVTAPLVAVAVALVVVVAAWVWPTWILAVGRAAARHPDVAVPAIVALVVVTLLGAGGRKSRL